MKRENMLRRRRVDIVVAMNAFAGQGKIEGIFDFQNEGHPWNINLMYAHDWITPKALAKSIASGTEGLILLSHPPAEIIQTVIRSGIPAVIEASRHEAFPESPRCIHIFCDPHSLASEAATHLLSRQTFADFCYVNTREEEIWSIDRGEEFREILKDRGYNCRITFPRKHNLARELKRLSRPAAVLAANDETAKMVIEACQGISLKVPDDIAVLGVDDDPTFCATSTPMISSVAQDFRKCGYLASSALERMMNGETPSSDEIRYGAKGISIRKSTLSDSPHALMVQKALNYIDENACHGIRAQQVCDYLGVSRRLIDLRFREIHRISMHEVIIERRIEEVKKLLTTTEIPISEITQRCGFANRTHLKKIFYQRFGMTMRDYRNRNGEK